MIYIQLFLSFLQIGLFSVGGGYAAIPLVQSLIVERQGWITMTEFTNLITIAERRRDRLRSIQQPLSEFG